jgi:hypothetical protein
VCIALGAVLLGYTIVRRRWIGERGDRDPAAHAPGVRARIVVMIVLLAVIALAVTSSALDHDGIHAPNCAGKYSRLRSLAGSSSISELLGSELRDTHILNHPDR